MASLRRARTDTVHSLKVSDESFEDEEIIKDWKNVDQDDNIPVDFDDERHAHLLEAVRVLDGKRGRIIQRSEHAPKASEYHKRANGDAATEAISYAELVGALQSTASHGELKKQLRTMQERSRVLDEPLAKPASERLQRSVAYEKTSKDVSKWEPVVEANRRAEHLHFPLQRPDNRLPAADGFVQRFQLRTPLELEVAALLGNSDHVLTKTAALTKAEERALRAMDVQEAKRRRAELQKHRALLSYQEAKAHRQNKIKSKRYHRILRKEKQKQEEKTLQTLAATDPEAYAMHVDKLDKMRMEERMSLKHRGGSKFAKHKTRYGKFDDISRQAMSDMYDHSRRLTEKMQQPDLKEDDDKIDKSVVSAGVTDRSNRMSNSQVPAQVDTKNVWLSTSIKGGSATKRVQFSDSTLSSIETTEAAGEPGRTSVPSMHVAPQAGSELNENRALEVAEVQEPVEACRNACASSSALMKSSVDEMFSALEGVTAKASVQVQPSATAGSKKRKRRKRKSQGGTASTEGSSAAKLQKQDAPAGAKAAAGVEKKSGPSIGRGSAAGTEEEECSDEEMMSETLERRQTLGDIDIAMQSDAIETIAKVKVRRGAVLAKADSLVGVNEVSTNGSKRGKGATASVQLQVAHLALPDVVVTGDGEQDEVQCNERELNIHDAFADDAVIEEFTQEKHALEERDKPKDIDMTLPGWGEWGGVGVLPISASGKQRRRKARRFLVKAAPAPPRQDRNLSKVIINEAKSMPISKHQVSELPYPFSSVQQFESSIRMPIGKTWNPETAYRSMIAPHVTTRLGTVIDPIDASEVFRKQKQKQPSSRGKAEPYGNTGGPGKPAWKGGPNKQAKTKGKSKNARKDSVKGKSISIEAKLEILPT